MNDHELSCTELRRACDLSSLGFEHTDELADSQPRFGQQRAIDAIRFGLQLEGEGYNLFVLGQPGCNRHTLTRELLEVAATGKAAPDDWCYVNNFSDPQTPRKLRLPAGRGRAFRDDMQDLIEELQLAVPAAFQSEDYRNQRKAIDEETKKELHEHWEHFKQSAQEKNITVMQTATGYVLVPIHEGSVLSDEEFAALPEAERTTIEATIEHLSEQLQTHIEKLPQLQKRHRKQVKALDRSVMEHAVGLLISATKERYSEFPDTIAYLDDVYADLIEQANDLREQPESPLPFLTQNRSQAFRRYRVNLMVANDPDAAAPVIYETNPTYPNVIGKIEHQAEMGALLTDFRMIRPGAFHMANGGYLLMDAGRLLSRPFIWEAFKQAMLTRQVRIESPGETYGLVSTSGLQPEPIPLDIKVVLIGERRLYYLLCALDNEFKGLFKVAADFDDDVDNTPDNASACAHLIAGAAKAKGLRPFTRPAVERILEERSREAGDNERLSAHMRSLTDLLCQANFWAGSRNATIVEVEDIDKALAEQERRLDRVYSRVLDAIDRQVLLIDTSGSAVGQVNGLSVTGLDDYRFGHPVRITATTRMGTGEVVDIEREVELGGAIHSKGVMILSSALSSRYATESPLSLHATLVFEQSYGGVEGDSASVAEFCALLSSLSGIPIRQNLAVTGSVNQHGRVQVIGGVNEKIEGFFQVCKKRGLDGSHGVVMPRDNVKHLMLKSEVVRAVDTGKFHIYAVQSINEAISVLTGMDAGERNEQGEYPGDTVNFLVEQKLVEFAQQRRAYGRERDEHDSR